MSSKHDSKQSEEQSTPVAVAEQPVVQTAERLTTPVPPVNIPPAAMRYNAPNPEAVAKKIKARRRKARIKTIITTVIVLAVLGALAWGFVTLFFQEPPTKILTETVKIGTISNPIRGWGTVRPGSSQSVFAPQRAMVLECPWNVGDQVTQGDVLMVLDAKALDDEIAQLQKKIEDAQDAITKLVGDQATIIANLTVRTPFAGKFLAADNIAEWIKGDFVAADTDLGTLVDDQTMKLTLYFSYAYEYDIQLGQKAEVSIPASMSVLQGTVSNINKIRRVTEDGAVTFEVELALDNPGALTKDMDATAVLYTPAGESILPSAPGKLDYNRTAKIVAKSPGNIASMDLQNYKDYRAGAVLLDLTYEEKDEDVLAQQKIIADTQEEIDEKADGYSQYTIYAEISGTITEQLAFPGEYVEATNAVMTISHIEKVFVDLTLEAADTTLIQPGFPVTIIGPGEVEYQGSIKSISLEGQANQGGGHVSYLPVTVEADNLDGNLRPNYGVECRIDVDTRDNVLLAPVESVKNTKYGPIVFVQKKSDDDVPPDNLVPDEELTNIKIPKDFYPVKVVIGIGNETGIEIVSGLNEGDVVFTDEIEVVAGQEEMEVLEEGIIVDEEGGGDDVAVADGDKPVAASEVVVYG